MSGAWIRSMKLMGEIDSRKSASFSGSPYSAARSGLRHGAVRAKNVLKLAMPTMSTAAAHFRSAQNVIAASVMNPPYEPPITPIRSPGATPDSASHPAAARRDVDGGGLVESGPRDRDRPIRRDGEAVADEIGREVAGRQAPDRRVRPVREEPDLGAAIDVQRVGDSLARDLELVDDTV